MINVSNEFKEIVSGNDRTFYASAEITLNDNTVLNLDNSQLSGLKIDDGGKFGLGTAIINKLTLSINNLNDEFSDYDFTDAIIRPSIGLQLSETIETLHKGVFVAENPKAIGSIIHITAFDNMIKFDRPFSEVSQVFPCTIRDLLITVCNHCGVSLATSTFYNQDFIIKERPDDVATCREVISWIAGISVSIARCNVNGALELRWYDIETLESEANIDGGKFDSDTPYSSGDSVDGGTFAFNDGDNIDGGNFTDLKKYHHFYSHIQTPTVATDDVVITGVSIPVTAENSVTYGESGYMYTLEGNKLIQDELDAEYVAEKVGQKIIGMRFRPLSIVVRSDPTVEAGDIAIVSTRKGVYQTLISSVSYSVGQPMRIENDAEPPLRNSSKRYSEVTKAVVEARKLIEVETNARTLAIQNLANELANSSGLYMTKEQQPDLSFIYYMHDKPTLAESMIVWKLTAEAFGISTDGGTTYPYGLDVNGDAILNRIYAIGLDADYINAGSIRGIEIVTNRGKIAGLNISENGFVSDNDILQITNSYDGEGNPIRGRIQVRDSIPDPSMGVVNSYTEYTGNGVLISADKDVDENSLAKRISELTIDGVSVSETDKTGDTERYLSIMPGIFESDTPNKSFYFTPYTGGDSVIFMDGYGMQVYSDSKIYINAPEIELFGSKDFGQGTVIDGQNFYNIYSKVVANAFDISLIKSDIQAIKAHLNI